MKFEFHNQRGLFRRRHELPFLHRVLAGLDEQGVSAYDSRAFHTSVRGNDDFNLDLPRNVHSSSKFWVHRRFLGLDLALGFVRRTRLGKKMSAAVVATAHFFHRLILIDTTPDGMRSCPA